MTELLCPLSPLGLAGGDHSGPALRMPPTWDKESGGSKETSQHRDADALPDHKILAFLPKRPCAQQVQASPPGMYPGPRRGVAQGSWSWGSAGQSLDVQMGVLEQAPQALTVWGGAKGEDGWGRA